MKKYLLTLLSALFLFALAPVASANFDVVDYDDTDNDFDVVLNDESQSVLVNGAFDIPASGSTVDCAGYGQEALFQGWCSWADSTGGWESANLSSANMSFGGGDWNNGMGWYISNNGATSGGYYAGSFQPLNVAPGNYFISLSLSAWYFDNLASGPYNSVAWYAISDTANPAMVTEWRELYPDRYVCENSDEICAYAGRDEMVTVGEGNYLHLKVGHKFPEFLAKTVFVFDDFFMVPEGTHDYTGQDHGFYNWVNANSSIIDGNAQIQNLNTGAISELVTNADFKIHDDEGYYSGPVTTYVTVAWNENGAR